MKAQMYGKLSVFAIQRDNERITNDKRSFLRDNWFSGCQSMEL